MFSYQLRMGVKSLKRNPWVSMLMIGAIALGVGVCISTLTVYHMMAQNPIESRNDVLYSVTLDSWSPTEPFRDNQPQLPPPELTYRDATALKESNIPERSVIMYKTSFVIEPSASSKAKPYLLLARAADGNFFKMFDVPFQYGGGWPLESDTGAQLVTVLSKETNDKVFGGANSVGKTARLDGRDYRVVGVLKAWQPTPKFYDLTNGKFNDSEDAYVPFNTAVAIEAPRAGNTNCWREEAIDSTAAFLHSDCVWIQMWAELSSPAKVAQYQTFIDNYVRDQKALGRFPRPLNNRLTRPDDWLNANHAISDDNRVLVGLSFMFLAVCTLNMIGLLLAKFLGAASFVGLRRALGASRAMVFREHLIEVGLIGFVGGLLGLGIAVGGLALMRTLYDNLDRLTRLDLPMIAASMLIAIVAGVLAGLYPAWRVCRVQPAAYLKS
jgi:putative ABC transport system permease protein